MNFREQFKMLPKPVDNKSWVYRPYDGTITQGYTAIAEVDPTGVGMLNGEAIAALNDWIALADRAISALEGLGCDIQKIGSDADDADDWIKARHTGLTTGEHR
jgi:hypothetical protein